MWPSQRRGSINLDSRQGKVQARSRDRRGIRPIVTLLEDRQLLSTISLLVTTLADDPSGNIPGYTTLRDAITQANASIANQVTINFAVDGTIDLTNPLPALSNNISLEGPGASNLTVQRDSSATPFSVVTVEGWYNGSVAVTVSGMTISGGNAGSGSGGGIENKTGCTLMVNNCTFTNNSAPSGGGGGIDNCGTMTVVNSSFTGNSAKYGGGIDNEPADADTATVSNSTFMNNSAPSGGGGGILNSYESQRRRIYGDQLHLHQ